MDRIIQPYKSSTEPLQPRQAKAHFETTRAGVGPVMDPPVTKTPGDFMRALRKRFWIVVITACAIGGAGAIVVNRLQPVYRAVGHIQIEPPAADPSVAIIVGTGQVGPIDRDSIDRYVPNRLALIYSKLLALQVLRIANIGHAIGGDPAAELTANLSFRRLMAGTSQYEIALDGPDAARVTKLLSTWLLSLRDKLQEENDSKIEISKASAQSSLADLQKQLQNHDKLITNLLNESPLFGPAGKHLLLEEYTQLKSTLESKKMHFEDLAYEDRLSHYYPNMREQHRPQDQKLALLAEEIHYYEECLAEATRIVRGNRYKDDPAVRRLQSLRARRLDEMAKLQGNGQPMMPDRAKLVMARANQEIEKLQKEVQAVKDRMQASMPKYQEYLSKLNERERLEREIASMGEKLTQFQMVSKTLKSPVEILLEPTEPTSPVKPNRPLLIGLAIALGIMLGTVIVCFLEYLDRAVRQPEQLTVGLRLPLLAMIPRIRRTAQTDRGGHLWIPGAPYSDGADAYRNLRASLLGPRQPRQAADLLLITSAKNGEGKSTTALNLAATCARAGERTLLIDVDLRGPSLSEALTSPGEGAELGLVDVLQDELPWQRAIVQDAELPCLHLLPAGDPRGVPIEALGSHEMRQLLLTVAGQYHRVILDGPAVLGLADCRMIGQMVDAAVLVVRSGAHEIRPLRWAQEMLEQSRVPIAGLVFNDLADDWKHWCSHGLASAAPLAAAHRPGLSSPVGTSV